MIKYKMHFDLYGAVCVGLGIDARIWHDYSALISGRHFPHNDIYYHFRKHNAK